MERRVRKYTVVLVLLMSVLVIFNLNTQATTITQSKNYYISYIVDKNGDGDYNSIQEAIDNVPSGSTIYVNPGEYPEVIEIKKTINLIGGDRDNTLINPVSGKNKYAIRVGAPKVSIHSFSVMNGAPGLYTSAIRITESNIEISDCSIYDTPIGIALWTSDNIIDNCKFWGCEDEGIVLLGSTYSECDNNKITNCEFFENCDGIELQYSSENTISNCEFYDNTHTGIDAIASSNNENTITNCHIYNNRVHGIYFYSSSDNQIIDCTITDNGNGNVVMNQNSENNQIIYTYDSSEPNKETSEIKFDSYANKISHKNSIQRFIDRITGLNSGRISELLEFIGF
jgi:parallel beta-helix repeat protein